MIRLLFAISLATIVVSGAQAGTVTPHIFTHQINAGESVSIDFYSDFALRYPDIGVPIQLIFSEAPTSYYVNISAPGSSEQSYAQTSWSYWGGPWYLPAKFTYANPGNYALSFDYTVTFLASAYYGVLYFDDLEHGPYIGQTDWYSFPPEVVSGTGQFIIQVGSVPEPSTWAMMIMGFASVGYMTYRQRRMFRTTA